MRHEKGIQIGELNGRNGADPPLNVPDDQAVEMLNVDRWDGMIARKRGGTATLTETGGTAFQFGVHVLVRYVPGTDETAAELWGMDTLGLVKRMAGGATFANVTLDDAYSGSLAYATTAATLNGKLFLAYESTQDRLHCWDPSLSSPRVRRVGLATPPAPTAVNTGAGAYPAVLRYYRVRWLQMNGTIIVRRSEPGPSLSFTPSGGGATVTISHGTLPNEGETHWELEVSTDNVVFTTFTNASGIPNAAQAIHVDVGDGAATTAYAAFPLSDPAGTYGLFPSVKYLITDGNRLIGATARNASGATSGGKTSRIWFTSVLGASDKGDDERVPNTTSIKNWVDLNEKDGGGITGLGGPINGVIIAFKYRQIWRLAPTGDVTAPYLPKKMIDGIGCVSHRSISMGIDEGGRPALYFLSHNGAHRLVMNGTQPILQYLWRDNEDLSVDPINVELAHAVYYFAKHQWWLWFAATAATGIPDTCMVFDPILAEPDAAGRIRKGWFRWTGNLAATHCSCLTARVIGATSSLDLVPYIARGSSTAIQKCDTGTDDAGTAFQAYVKTKPLPVAPLGTNAGVSDVQVLAEVASGVTITLTLDRDYGLETRTSTVLLTASASETRTIKKFEGSALSGAGTIQAKVGDASAVSNAWVLDALVVPVQEQERR